MEQSKDGDMNGSEIVRWPSGASNPGDDKVPPSRTTVSPKISSEMRLKQPH